MLLNRMILTERYTFLKISDAAITFHDERLLKYFIKCSFCEFCTGVSIINYQSTTKYTLLDEKYEDKLNNISIVFQRPTKDLQWKVDKTRKILESHEEFVLGFIEYDDVTPNLTENDYRKGFVNFESHYHGNELLYFLTKIFPSLRLTVEIAGKIRRAVITKYVSAKILSLKSNRESYRIQFDSETSYTQLPRGSSLMKCNFDEDRIAANGQPFTVTEGVGFWGNCFTFSYPGSSVTTITIQYFSLVLRM
ncbi:hypothetical protein SNEBB_005408 [Seison nebaliae]|nr:hypothetical protein SNEBB_005408 [Seison nebaliae]